MSSESDSILLEAHKLVHGDRGASYGSPLDDFSRTATMFNALRGKDLTAEDVAIFMMCVKLSREANKHKRDNLTDLCGYAETYMMLKEERHRRETLTTTFCPKGEVC